jgi:hypothetical protein
MTANRLICSFWRVSKPLNNRPHQGTEQLFHILRLIKGLRVTTYATFSYRESTKWRKRNGKRKEYTKDDVKLLKAHSKARTPVAKLSKLMKRSEGSLRQKARTLGIGLGHQR